METDCSLEGESGSVNGRHGGMDKGRWRMGDRPLINGGLLDLEALAGVPRKAQPCLKRSHLFLQILAATLFSPRIGNGRRRNRPQSIPHR